MDTIKGKTAIIVTTLVASSPFQWQSQGDENPRSKQVRVEGPHHMPKDPIDMHQRLVSNRKI